jgi:hypothetical protein
LTCTKTRTRNADPPGIYFPQGWVIGSLKAQRTSNKVLCCNFDFAGQRDLLTAKKAAGMHVSAWDLSGHALIPWKPCPRVERGQVLKANIFKDNESSS